MNEPKRSVLRLKLPVKVNVPTTLKIEKPANIPVLSPKVIKASKAAKVVTPVKKPVNKPLIKRGDPKPTVPLLHHKLPRKEFNDLVVKVQKMYPKVFSAKGKPKVLAIRIHKELAKRLSITITKAKYFCMIYCNNKAYKAARITGAKRYDLEGNVTGEVT